MTNAYYNATGNPLTLSRGTSSLLRNEFAAIQAGLALLPIPTALAGDQQSYAVDSGSVNAVVIPLPANTTALTDGQKVVFKIANSVTGASTIKVGTFTIPLIRPDGTATQSGDLVAGQIVDCRYSLSQASFQIQNIGVATASLAASSASAAAASATAAASSATASAASASIFMGRNKIINGDMRIAQRGASYTLTNSLAYGSVDRWMVSGNATANSFANQNLQLGTPYQYGGCAYLLQVGRISGAAAVTPLTWQTVLETVNSVPLAGKYVCLSYYAAAGPSFTGTGLVTSLFTGTGIDQAANILGVWTGTAAPINTLQAITTTPTRYSFTCFIPANTSQIGVYFNYTPSGTATANDYVLFSGVQLEVVPSLTSPPTQFEILDYGVEMGICKRYYQTINNSWLGYAAAVQNCGGATNYAQMRAVPTVAQLSNNYNLSSINITPTVSTFTPTANSLGFYRASAGAGAAQYSELVSLSAEL